MALDDGGQSVPAPMAYGFPSLPTLGGGGTLQHTSALNIFQCVDPYSQWHANMGADASISVGVWPYTSVLDASYNPVPVHVLPFREETLPLINYLLPATKENIWRGEYVDIFSLLTLESEKDSDKEVDTEKERARKKSPSRPCANWLSEFIIYTGVIIKIQPW